MAALESIEIDNESAPQKLIAQNCTSLTNLSAYTTQLDLESIDLTGCTALTELHLTPYFNNTTLILKDCINLETLLFESFTGIPNHEIDFSGCVSLAQVTLHGDFDNIDVSSLISLTTLDISGNVSSFICEDMPGLEQLNIEGDFTNNFSINNCPVLKSVDMMIWGLVDNISLNNFPELTHLHLDSGVTGSVIITNCQKLIDLYVFAGPVDTFDLSGCSALTQINELSFLDANNLIFKNCISIVDLDLSNTITSQLLDLSGMISLTNITLFDAPETILLDGCYNLKTFDVSDFTWSRTLDFSSCISLEEVNLMSAFDLETLILKNGSNEAFSLAKYYGC